MLSKPLQHLPLDSEGHLIPTQDVSPRVAKSCPVTLKEDQEKEFAKWMLEFPRAAAKAEDGSEGPSGAGNEEENAAKRSRGQLAVFE